jgi:hypothetical protein
MMSTSSSNGRQYAVSIAAHLELPSVQRSRPMWLRKCRHRRYPASRLLKLLSVIFDTSGLWTPTSARVHACAAVCGTEADVFSNLIKVTLKLMTTFFTLLDSVDVIF